MIFNWHRTSKVVTPIALVALAALGVSCTSGDGFQSADATQPGANAGAGQGGNAGGEDGGNQGGGGSQGTGTDGGPGSGSCMPGLTEECWESVAGVSFGAEAPQGHAICHAGERTCGEDATWGACQGAVGPAAVDSCESGNDANCNGTPNEGCTCDDADAPRACPDDSGCGTQSCTGSVWGSCVGDGVTLRCNPDAVDERQVCGTDGVWTADPCAADSVCVEDGSCRLLDGESCTTGSDCESGTCGSFYLDEDGDEYRADATAVKLCGAAVTDYVAVANDLGDDCDDGDEEINPGAVESCDGIDNDCDTDIDLDDGLSLSGTVVEVGPTSNVREQPEIAWAEEESLYGIAFEDDSATTEGIYFTTLDQAGTVITAVTNAGPTSDGYALHLVWGTNNFGLTWFNDGDISFRTVGSNGSLGVIRDIINGAMARPQVARVGTGNWAVSYIDYSSGFGLVGAKTVTAAGVIGSHVDVSTQNSNFSYLVGTASTFAATVELADSSAKASVYSSALASPATVTVSGSAPIMGPGPNGFAIAVQKGAGMKPQFYSYDEAGDADCGPVDFADSTFVPADAVGTADGYLIVSSGSTVRAQLILPGCTLGPIFTVDAATGSNTRVSGGTAGWGVVWEGASNKVKRRFFGPKFCD